MGGSGCGWTHAVKVLAAVASAGTSVDKAGNFDSNSLWGLIWIRELMQFYDWQDQA